MKTTILITLLILLAGCASPAASPTATEPSTNGDSASQAAMPGMDHGSMSGMMMRHHADVPEEYAGLTSPTIDDAGLGRGQENYALLCASCHGELGLGDGPAAAALDPAPAPIGHTAQMLSDDHVFWRVSEGGAGFESAMPAWKDVLDEQQRWEVIAYVRQLGQDSAAVIATAQAARQADMLAQALAQGVLTEAEVQAFQTVHDHLEAYMLTHADLAGSMDTREAAALLALVDAGTVTAAQVQAFKAAHDKLAQSGLMP